LTTLFAGADKLGTIASETLLARLDETSEDQKPPMQYFAVPELVVRESSIGAAASHASTAIKAPRKRVVGAG
jgi:LacI family transcriptional regulator